MRSPKAKLEEMIGEKVAAKILDLSVESLRGWRKKKAGPVFYRLGGAVRYRASDLLAFIEKGAVVPENPKSVGDDV